MDKTVPQAASDQTVPGDDAALFGKSLTPLIVAVHPVPDQRGQHAAKMRVYFRDVQHDTVSTKEEPVFPFFFLSDASLLHTFPRNRYQFQELAGNNFYKFLVVFKSWNAYWDAIRHIEKAKNQQK